METKNLMFDLGGVIMDIKRENAVAALEAIGLKDADSQLGKYGQKGAFLALEKGLITPAEFRAELRKSIGREVSDDEIDEAFTKFLIGIPVNRLRQLEGLKVKGYRIYLLSNTNPIMWDRFILPEFRKDGKSINHYFDGVVTSFGVRAYKPDPAIFMRAVDEFHFLPQETVFFDDSESNCEAARQLGFKAVHVADANIPYESYI